MKNEPSKQANMRILLYLKLMIGLLIVSLVGILVLAFSGYHPGWVGFIASLGFAELTRRISAEQNPEKAMGWRDIWRFTFTGKFPERGSNEHK